MRNNIHQFNSMASRYSHSERLKRKDKKWYRALKTTMTNEWVDKDTTTLNPLSFFSWLWSKIRGIVGK